jgi:hypothetical protein
VTGGAAGAAAARHQAETILRESRFHGSSAPHPLRPLLQSLGDALQSAERGLERAITRLGAHLPGGTVTAWALVIIVLGVIIACVARMIGARTIGRRTRHLGDGSLAEPPPTAAVLEARADAAERERRYELALRLRFRAGLAGLAERERVRSPDSRASVEISRELVSEDFDVLAGRFDEVVYGGQPARDDDVQEARRRWPAVLGARSVR